MAPVAVVTVTYRGGSAPQRWADALWEAWQLAAGTGREELQVVAVDSASGDGTPARLRQHAPWVDVVELPRNVGFAAGCNVGLSRVRPAGTVVILNPDIRVRADFFEKLRALQWPEAVAAVGPAIYTADGDVEQSARGFPRVSTGLFGRTTLLSRLFPHSGPVRRELVADPAGGARDVDWVSGACLVVPWRSLEKVGLLDEGYFMYWEDADWCRRARNLGLRVRYEPDLVVYHHQGASTASRPVRATVAFHRSAFRYYHLHVARTPPAVVGAGVALAIRCTLKVIARSLAMVNGQAGPPRP